MPDGSFIGLLSVDLPTALQSFKTAVKSEKLDVAAHVFAHEILPLCENNWHDALMNSIGAFVKVHIMHPVPDGTLLNMLGAVQPSASNVILGVANEAGWRLTYGS